MDKERIMKHMNADHAHNLADYLQFYCGVPVSAFVPAASGGDGDVGGGGKARMVDLTDAGMTMVIDGPAERATTAASTSAGAGAGANAGAGGGKGAKQYFVPFDPPLQGLQGIRPRVIEMAHTAAKALRPDDVQPATAAAGHGHGHH